jgi:DNA-binding transcriptional ArsR family regulator
MVETCLTKEEKAGLIPLDDLERAAGCLRTIAHPHRLRIIQILLLTPCSVGKLAEACGIPSNVASEHLRLLKDRGLLVSRREGRQVFYSVEEPALASIMACVRKRFGCKEEAGAD